MATGGFNCCPVFPFVFRFGMKAWKERPVNTGVDCCALIGFWRFQTRGLKNSGSSTEVNELRSFALSVFQSTDLFVMASNSFQQAKSIFEVVNNVHNEVSNRQNKNCFHLVRPFLNFV